MILLLACSTPDPDPVDPTCPAGMAHVPAGAFQAGATGEQVGAALEWPEDWNLPRARTERTVEGFCIDRYEYPNERGEKPRVFVTWPDAKALCEEQGKRLCTEDEWTKACAGPEGRLFPYGDTWQAETCNDEVDVGDESGRGESGSWRGCVSQYGVYDLQGNVSEWVSDVHGYKDSFRVLRGGTMWLSIYGQGCMSRHAHEERGPTHGDDGFRCCSAAP